jgi:hypothetical protein
VENIDDPALLYWKIQREKKPPTIAGYIPCGVRVNLDERMGLGIRFFPNDKLVRFAGVNYSSSGVLDRVSPKNLVPYFGGEGDPTKWSAEFMQMHLDSIRGEQKFQENTELNLRVEELALQYMLDEVLSRHKEKECQKAAAAVSKAAESENIPPKLYPAQWKDPVCGSPKPATATQHVPFAVALETQAKQKLRAGDVIEYFHPVMERELCKGVIVTVNPPRSESHHVALEMADSMLLPPTCYIRLVQRRLHNKLVEPRDTKAFFEEISKFQLDPSQNGKFDIPTKAQEMGQAYREMQNDLKEGETDFWKEGAKQTDTTNGEDNDDDTACDSESPSTSQGTTATVKDSEPAAPQPLTKPSSKSSRKRSMKPHPTASATASATAETATATVKDSDPVAPQPLTKPSSKSSRKRPMKPQATATATAETATATVKDSEPVAPQPVTKPSSKSSRKSAVSEAQSTLRPPRRSIARTPKKKAPNETKPAWIEGMEKLIEDVQKKRSKRCDPEKVDATEEALKVAIRARLKLEDEGTRENKSNDELLIELEEVFGVPGERLRGFLNGNKNNLIKVEDLKKLTDKWKVWLGNVGVRGAATDTEPMEGAIASSNGLEPTTGQEPAPCGTRTSASQQAPPTPAFQIAVQRVQEMAANEKRTMANEKRKLDRLQCVLDVWGSLEQKSRQLGTGMDDLIPALAARIQKPEDTLRTFLDGNNDNGLTDTHELGAFTKLCHDQIRDMTATVGSRESVSSPEKKQRVD